jgi:hypothetical protein
MTASLRREFVWPDLPRALHEHQPWGKPGIEPPLGEVLEDPIVQAVMRRDGVSLAALQAVIARVLPLIQQAARSSSRSRVPSTEKDGRSPASHPGADSSFLVVR